MQKQGMGYTENKQFIGRCKEDGKLNLDTFSYYTERKKCSYKVAVWCWYPAVSSNAVDLSALALKCELQLFAQMT